MVKFKCIAEARVYDVNNAHASQPQLSRPAEICLSQIFSGTDATAALAKRNLTLANL